MKIKNFILHSLRVCVTIVILTTCNSVALPSIFKHIDITESESYGDWRYDTIEFTDSLTILRGTFISKSHSSIFSERDEYIEVDGNKYFVIDNNLPYAFGEIEFEPSDTMEFTYLFPPIRNTIGLYNVKHERFVIPVFFIPGELNSFSAQQLSDSYYNHSIKDYSKGNFFSSLRWLEEFYNLTKDNIKVSDFLVSHVYSTNDEASEPYVELKKAQLYLKINNLSEFQKTMVNFNEEYEFNIKIITDIIDIEEFVSNISSEDIEIPFVILCLRLMEYDKQCDAAQALLSKIKQNKLNEKEKNIIIYHEAFLKAVSEDSIHINEIDKYVIKNTSNKAEQYYHFMYNQFYTMADMDRAVLYADKILSMDAVDLPQNQQINITYELAEGYHNIKQYDKAAEYHRIFDTKSRNSLNVNGKINDDILYKRRQCCARLLTYSDYSSCTNAAEFNKEYIADFYGNTSKEYAQNLYHAAIAYQGIGNYDKSEKYFNKALDIFKTVSPQSHYPIDILYYLSMHSIGDDYSKAESLINEGIRLCDENGDSRRKLKFLRNLINLSLKEKKYDTMYIAFEESQKIVNEYSGLYDDMFLNSFQGDFFLDIDLFDKSLEMYTKAEMNLMDLNIDPNSDAYVQCLQNILSLQLIIDNDKSRTFHYSVKLWESLRSILVSALKKLPKSDRYKIVELYEDNIDLLQSSLLYLNTTESISMAYDLSLFRKGLLLRVCLDLTILNSNILLDPVPHIFIKAEV